MSRRGLPWVGVSVVLVLAAWLFAGRPPLVHTTAPRRDGLTKLGGIEGLRTAFNADKGTTRLILILSPT